LSSLVLIVLSAAILPFACSDSASPTQSSVPSIDRHDPEAVLRGYFSEWRRGDWAGQASFMASQYAGMRPEPVESLRILELRRVEGSSSRCLYGVVFEITLKGHGISMASGRYGWSYELKWDAQRQSWIITNYGAG